MEEIHMKKVLALVLAVMMLATVAFAYKEGTKYNASANPGSSIKIDNKTGITKGAETVTVFGSDDSDTSKLTYTNPDRKDVMDSGVNDKNESTRSMTGTDYALDVTDVLFRAVTNENYSVSSLKVTTGRSLIKGVEINDKEERAEVKFVQDLNNTTAKSFDLSFTLKGKGKMILKDGTELTNYQNFTGKTDKKAGDRVSIPDVKFSMSGTVGYGKVEVNIGDDTDEDLEDLESITGNGVDGVNLDKDVVKFKKGGTIGTGDRIAGSYTADAILTQPYGEALTLEARVYHNDVLFFDCDHAPDRDIIGRLADSDADMDFYIFNSDKNFTTFNSNAKLYFNDAEEDDFVYQIKDQKLVPVGEYDEDEACWVVKTRTLGAYVVSDVELKEFEAAAGTVDGNPDTGANDVVGIATALAAVALVSAAAVSLKK